MIQSPIWIDQKEAFILPGSEEAGQRQYFNQERLSFSFDFDDREGGSLKAPSNQIALV